MNTKITIERVAQPQSKHHHEAWVWKLHVDGKDIDPATLVSQPGVEYPAPDAAAAEGIAAYQTYVSRAETQRRKRNALASKVA